MTETNAMLQTLVEELPLERFVKAERRRVSVENIVLLPVARQRLSQGDLAWLSRAMRSRRLSNPAHAN
ncbi:MAG: hypothetical protein Q7T08_00845 [Devosia sp.]|nr:hypothetical protein [Devosia sp.]